MSDEPCIICVKQSDQTISQGARLWGPDENGIASIELDGRQVVGIYVPSLFDAAKSEDSLPFE